MNVTYNKLVQVEINKICDYYDDCAYLLGDKFFVELISAIEAIKQQPLRWPPIEINSDKRKGRIKNFPYVIVYRVIDAANLRILVVKHQKRRPNFGMRRK